MKNAWKSYLKVRAPRYTSFPTALHFDDEVCADDYYARLSVCAPYEPLSLYVHVPFCQQLCWYCGCNMRVEKKYSRALIYVEALIKEIETVGRALGGRGRPVSVHFGGGTPNYLHPVELQRILTAIETNIGLTDDTALAIELDPRLVSDEDIKALIDAGFSRMSLGIQDFDPVVQEKINRVQPYDMIENAVSVMRQLGIDDISFDILYGLPGQSEQGFSQTLKKVTALSPDRISVFGYAHLPSAIPHQRMILDSDLPSDGLRAALTAMADDRLVLAGYTRIGFDHYAKPGNSLGRAAREGRLHRNFQGFTDDVAETLLAFGASAIGFIDGAYFQNQKQIGDYQQVMKRGGLPTARGVIRTEHENVIARTITELLCRFHVDIRPVLAAEDNAGARRICSRLEQFEHNGLILWENDHITILPAAYALARVVATAFDPYMLGATKYTQAV